ncbi:MmgE/PrpD family protein [Acidisphaera sp. L21]|uniref:MmgE/PrpD family protein n=1 Tax=Acidisphaera sp. L21 TaxID=1641851 RepID=UPI00131C7036|nr:MmgE/PrpD family protein [Acidisphaera sp. L21]
MSKQIDGLAQFVASAAWDDFPAAVQHRAKLVLLDTVGVILAGSLRPEVIALRARLAPTAGTGATLFAPGLAPAAPQTAAMLNAIAGRSIELCEGVRGLQSAVHILPGILAIGEYRSSTGKALLEALVLGYEAAGRLGLGYTPRPYSHPNGQISLLAAAAAGARLNGLDSAGISLAMRIATTMLMTPSYTNTAAGGTTLNLPAGMGAYAAVLAPEMAGSGYVAQEDAIEEALGTMVGAAFDNAALLTGLGSSWQIAEGYFRFYACCNPIHPALDSLQDCLVALDATPTNIERIDVTTYAFASVMCNPQPPNYFASKYSLPHAAATLVVRGGLGFADLDDSSLEDPVIASLRHRVHITEDPAMTALGPDRKPAHVTVTLADGRTAQAACENSKRDTFHPDPEPGVRSKFAELAGTMLTADGIATVEHAIDHAEDWGSVGDLVALLHRHAKS